MSCCGILSLTWIPKFCIASNVLRSKQPGRCWSLRVRRCAALDPISLYASLDSSLRSCNTESAGHGVLLSRSDGFPSLGQPPRQKCVGCRLEDRCRCRVLFDPYIHSVARWHPCEQHEHIACPSSGIIFGGPFWVISDIHICVAFDSHPGWPS